MKAKDLDELFDKGEEDVLQYFDVTKVRRVNRQVAHTELDLPIDVLQNVDLEANRMGISRDQLVTRWLEEKLASLSAAE